MRTNGLVYAIAAYVIWGFFPAYWKLLQAVPSSEIVAHRIIWSAVFLGFLAFFKKRLGSIKTLLRAPRSLLVLFATASLIGLNWGVYIYAVNSGHVLETSLGYFISPLVNVLLAVIFLRERLNRLQIVSILLATAGVVQLAWQGEEFPWIALILAFSFGFYGLFRKKLPVDPLSGSFLESALIALPAIVLLWLWAPLGQPYSHIDWGLLIFAGIITALPLLWFVEAARRTPLSVMGFLQYISPCLQFSLAVFAFGEPFLPVHARSFACIWAALAVFTVDLVLRRRNLG